MDKLSKAIQKLPPKQAIQIAEIIECLLSGKTNNLDIKKLRGFKNVFRVRFGHLRIIFKQEGEKIIILDIGKRSDNTYRNY